MGSNLYFIDPEANIHPSVKIGNFSTIEKNVTIGEGTIIDSNVTICENTKIGKNNHIFPGAVVGAIPQDLKFHGENSTVVIGDNNSIREFVTIHRGTEAKMATIIGDNNLIMAYCHVAHDCLLHNHIIMSNSVQLAGEIEVDDYAIIGGGTLVHQFTRIGTNVMIQGGCKINKDIPPYVKAAREPIAYCGINSVGLRRKNYTKEQISTIQDVYRLIYMSGFNNSEAIENILKEVTKSKERDIIVNFVKNSQRGIIRGYNF